MSPPASNSAALSAPPCAAPAAAPVDQKTWFHTNILPLEAALRAYLRGKFPALTDLDDILQETYARVLRAQASSSIAEIRPYLFATVRNAAFDHFRKASVRRLEPLGENIAKTVVSDKPDAAEHTSREQELALLHEAIQTLPPRCREAFVLCKLQKRSHREVAQELGISEKTIETQIAKGMLLCREFLKERGLPAT